ncbi:MAG: hypothetical protein HY899_19470 [Deltaproteobacteria bacterium]|nr:hypothetical protein [Deltaproteobacteria bacterium]
MRQSHYPQARCGGFPAAAFLAFCLAAMCAADAIAATNEDSLICAAVKDSYAANAYVASFAPVSEIYGEMTWCNMQVKAVEHCVPVEAVFYDTTAPDEGYRGPALQAEYTCYRIRCMNGEGNYYLGNSVVVEDTFGQRRADRPKVTRVCLPDR